MTVSPAPVQVPDQRTLAPSVTSVMSVANDKSDNEMILGALHRFPGICLTAEENPGKPQLGPRLVKGCATSHRLKWEHFPSNEVGISHSTLGGEKEGKDRCDYILNLALKFFTVEILAEIKS